MAIITVNYQWNSVPQNQQRGDYRDRLGWGCVIAVCQEGPHRFGPAVGLHRWIFSWLPYKIDVPIIINTSVELFLTIVKNGLDYEYRCHAK